MVPPGTSGRETRMRRLLIAAMGLAIIPAMLVAPSASTTGPPEVAPVADKVATQALVEPAGPVGMIVYAADGLFTIRTDGSHRRRLTTTRGYDPVWSPDGASIAYQVGDDIWLMDSDGGNQRRMVHGRSPAWAPDGHRVSYVCREGIDEIYDWGFSDLCLLDLRNGQETVVLEHAMDWPGVLSASWAPDGAWLVVARVSSEGDDYTRDTQLFRMRPDGTEISAIPNTEPGASEPAWSPDGATIVYTDSYGGRGGEGSGDLMSIRPDGAGKTRVTRIFGTESGAAWSPDGRRIAMDSQGGWHPTTSGIWTINPDGTGAELVVRAGNGPSWRPGFATAAAPDAKRVRASGPRIAYVAATDAGFDLFTVRPDGSRIRRLTTTGRVVEPAWSPDRSQIVFSDEAAPERVAALHVLDVRSGRITRVGGYFGTNHRGVAWSPDGLRLAYGDYQSFVILDLDTGKRVSFPFTGDGCCLRGATWSPDGTQIAFSQDDASGSRIVLVPSRGGELRTLTRLRGYEHNPAWSPDGQRILFSHQRWPRRRGEIALKSIRPDGTDLRRFVRTPELDVMPSWSPDGSRVAFYSDGPRPFGAAPQPGLWTVGPRGGAPRLVVRDRSIAYVDW